MPVDGWFYSNDPIDALGHMQRGNSIAHGFNRYAYANNNPYKYTDPDGKFVVLAPLIPYIPAAVSAGKALFGIGAAVGTVAVMNEALNDVNQLNESVDTDGEIDNLTEGLDSETDTRGRPRRGQFVNPEGTAQEALDSLTGESDGNGGKILPDGSRAGVHTSTGSSGGQTGENAGSQTLHINRPDGKQNVKIRFPNDKQKQKQ